MQLFGGFHDSCIREIHVATGHYVEENLAMTCGGPTTVHLLVQRQRANPSALELRFEEVGELRISPPQDGYVAIIFEAFFALLGNTFYWAEDARWTPEAKTPNDAGPKDVTWIAARRVWWRDASEWMGGELRYYVDTPGRETLPLAAAKEP
jgi:hypothetical protein